MTTTATESAVLSTVLTHGIERAAFFHLISLENVSCGGRKYFLPKNYFNFKTIVLSKLRVVEVSSDTQVLQFVFVSSRFLKNNKHFTVYKLRVIKPAVYLLDTSSRQQ